MGNRFKDWQLGFITGIFHAVDPIDVAQYSRVEYESYAASFIEWSKKVSPDYRPPDECKITSWLLKQHGLYLISHQKMVELARALSRS